MFGHRFVARIGVAALLAFGVPLVLGGPSALADSRPGWWGYRRAATYTPVLSTVKVPVRGGNVIGCTLHRPGHSGAAAPGRFPVVVWEFTPYTATHLTAPEGLLSTLDALLPGTGRATGFPAWLLRFANQPADYFASRGYIVAVCDVPGTGASTGNLTSWFRPIEAKENYDLIEWLARRPWSTGRVGQGGSSYASLTSQRVAALRPPHLKAIVPQIAPGNIYDWVYPGGIPSTQGTLWAAAVGALSLGRVSVADIEQSFASHPLYDRFWRQIDITNRLGDIRVPTLLFGGWQDLFTSGTVADFTGRSNNAWLVMGPGQHTPAQYDPNAPVPVGAILAWWDHWLKQMPHAPLPSARVTSFEGPVAGGRGWHQLSSWPPAGVHCRRMYLRADRHLSTTTGPAGRTSYHVNPVDGPARSWFFNYPAYPEDPIENQGPADTHRLTFTSRPLLASRALQGSARVHLRAALTAHDGYFVVKVEDVSPNGTVVAATDGYLLASHRDGNDHEAAVEPNRFYSYTVRVGPTDWRFDKNHRIRIAITSGDTPLVLPTAPAGTVTIANGPRGSWADLPLH